MVELEKWQERFASLGVNVAAMAYDPIETLWKFHDEKKLSYPLLSDENAKHVIAYGILNEHYKPGDPGYGVPHPGIIYLDGQSKVAYKIAAPGFRDRPSFEELYSTLKNRQIRLP